ncbi:hypothetical protein AWB82_04420 [Caballeronia glebae]|uniref:DUF1036 domain-containing protein n=1 Tax=Caballeronia glebae TaxID=1777143 RepID=A0A158BQB0_9BURK|nr:DUF1036 domain-containing protein [Caballeronia glebae]SAK72278.1 hypothetical protein AWB82_04420 [Caballeronia glebae]
MLKFVNATTQDIWVSYMFYSPDVCSDEGGNWQAIGWYHMAPGGSTVPYANDLDDVHNRYWCYYAENADRSVVWAGPYSVYAPENGAAFNRCYQIGDTASRIIGMRLFDVGDNDNFTMTLTR